MSKHVRRVNIRTWLKSLWKMIWICDEYSSFIYIYIYGPSRTNRKIAILFNNKLRKLSQKYDLEGSWLFPPLAGKVHDILLSSCRPDQFSFYFIAFFPNICWRNQVKYGDILWKYLWYIMQLLILLSDVDVLLN